MSEEKDKLQQIEEIKDSYQVDPAVAQRAIAQIEADKQKRAEKKKRPFLKFIPAIVASVCIIIAGVAVYFATLPPEIVYFDSSSVEIVNSVDVESILSEHNSNVKYLKDPNAYNQAGIVKENSKLGYIVQEILYMDTFDEIKFYAITLDHAEFEFEKLYDLCAIEYNYSNTFKVIYEQSEKKVQNFDKIVTNAKFIYDNHEYFITIESYNFGEVEPTAKIAHYLDLLLAE